ncbi:MAG TPA: hypothetical protein VMM79_10810 [Longimicrobiales bacterium]|nr:hypothetical protein [Longimicrobiales bacterium]
MRALPAIALLVFSAQPLLAQASPDLRRAGLPREEARRLEAVIDHDDTRRFRGDATIEAGRVINGPVYLERGILTVVGTIRGEVIVVDGDVVFQPGSSVTGDVTVIGGTTVNAGNAALAGTVTEYGEGFGLLAQAERLHDGRDDWRADRRGHRVDDQYSGQHANLGIRVTANYNRIEGLPVGIGPDIRSGGAHPTRLEALAVWRTDVGPLTNTQRMGYVGRLEQFVGSAFRFGGSVRSTVDPIEGGSLGDLEASLAAAMLHEDQRDYFEREGWSAYVRLDPRRSPLDVTLEYRDERHSTVAPRDPWTLLNRGDPWRYQPLVGEGRIRLIDGSVSWDTRRGADFVQSGWYARANVLRGIDGTLEVAAGDPLNPGTATYDAGALNVGTIDIRRYAPVGWIGSLGLRFVGGGSLDGEPLAPQFQHALGGAGTLPGYPLLSVDCGARAFSVAEGANRFFPTYGCDRYALAQIEYRGGFDIHVGHGSSHGVDIDTSVDWTVFFDAARGWALGDDPNRASTETLYDAGAGIILGGFGVYGAVPLTGTDRELRVFVRLGPRF